MLRSGGLGKLAGGTRAQSDLSAVMGHGALASMLWGHRTPASHTGLVREDLLELVERACVPLRAVVESFDAGRNSRILDGKFFPLVFQNWS